MTVIAGTCGSATLRSGGPLASGLAGAFALSCMIEAAARAPVSTFATSESVMIRALMFDLAQAAA
jgi:hypothetical protein